MTDQTSAIPPEPAWWSCSGCSRSFQGSPDKIVVLRPTKVSSSFSWVNQPLQLCYCDTCAHGVVVQGEVKS